VPYEVDVDHERRIIAVTGHGSGSTADTLAMVSKNQDTFSSCPGYDFLYDASQLAIESSPSDMIRIATALFGHAPESFRRFAIVVPEASANLARMFAALAQPFGVTANVFEDVDDAVSWLRVDRR
jgi:hypothetical protein